MVRVAGPVVVVRSSERSAHSVMAAPLKLRDGDMLRTGREGAAAVRFPDGSEIEIGPRSLFTLETQTSERISLFLSVGKLWAKVAKKARRAFEVYTPVCVCSVRGTRFIVEASDQRRSRTEVQEGTVAVQALQDDKPSGVPVLVGAGQGVSVEGARVGPVEELRAGANGAENTAALALDAAPAAGTPPGSTTLQGSVSLPGVSLPASFPLPPSIAPSTVGAVTNTAVGTINNSLPVSLPTVPKQ